MKTYFRVFESHQIKKPEGEQIGRFTDHVLLLKFVSHVLKSECHLKGREIFEARADLVEKGTISFGPYTLYCTEGQY